MKENPNLRIQLNGPEFLFGLDNLAQCLLALHNQHQLHFVQQNTGILDENEVRLRVSTFENSHNQLIIDLTPSLPNALPFDENYDTFIEFFKTLSRTYAYFLGDCTERRDFKPRDLKNYYNILEPAARDGESVDFSVINSKEPIEPFSLSSRQARAAQESIIEYESKLKEPTSSFHEDCVLNWYQTRNDPKSKLGDKSIIERQMWLFHRHDDLRHDSVKAKGDIKIFNRIVS